MPRITFAVIQDRQNTTTPTTFSRISGYEIESMEADVQFHQLPVIAVSKIMSYIPLQDKLIAVNVCRSWGGLIRGISSIWRNVSIDCSSTFGDDWSEINLSNCVKKRKYVDRKEYELQCERKLGELLLQLADTTDSIQYFKIDVWHTLQEAIFVRLLTKQKKLLSLNLFFRWKQQEGSSFLGYRSDRSSAQLLEIIKIHQNTLECLNLSRMWVTFQQWHNYLQAADFPNLRKISYPMLFSIEKVTGCSHFYPRHYTAKDKEALKQCFTQTLGHGKIEEIDMESVPEENILSRSGWDAVIANHLKDQILQGKARHLKKISLDSLFINEQYFSGYNLENIADDIETFMTQCPELMHIKCHFSSGTIPSEQFGKLIRHLTVISSPTYIVKSQTRLLKLFQRTVST